MPGGGQGGDNRSTAIAAALGITAGTLTSAVNLLEKKGYLLRRRDERDKRVVHLLPTERGRAADARHRDFHRQMVAHVLDGLTDEEAECTLRALAGWPSSSGAAHRSGDEQDPHRNDGREVLYEQNSHCHRQHSGITQAQGRELGIFVMPMPFYINDELFLEDITLSQEQFYQRLEEGADVKTTQPAPATCWSCGTGF